MNIERFLAEAQKKLVQAGIGTARLDALVLVEDELEKPRAWILAHQDFEIPEDSLNQLNKKVGRRAQHEPLAYIRGFSEFYGREFKVNKNVLEPRPESETMIELMLDLAKNQKLKPESLYAADTGTGSGALAITAKLELPKIKVIATDIDPKCLTVARQNAKAHKTDIKFYQGDLLKALPTSILNSQFSILLCNLPYVPRNWQINQAAQMEPKIAIDGGQDGLDVYRRLFDQLRQLKLGPKFVLTESLPPQHIKLAKIAAETNYRLEQTNDFIQLFVNQ